MPTEFAFLLDAPAVDVDGAVCEHPIAVLGDYKDPRYGEFSITTRQYQAWRRNLADLQNGRIPIDYDHAAEKGQTEAAGWITSLDLRDGKVVAQIEWTPAGAQAVRDKRWLYVSPTFSDKSRDEQGADHGPILHGVALTNRPFLRRGMPAISLSDELDGEFAAVDDELEPLELNWVEDVGGLPRKIHRLAGKLKRKGMTESHAIATAVNQARKFCAKGDEPEWCAAAAEWEAKKARAKALGVAIDLPPDSPATMPDLSKIATALGLQADADEATVLSAIAERGTPEPAPVKTLAEQAAAEGKIVLDESTLNELKGQAAQGAEALKQLHESRFDTAFTKALSEGRVDAKPETRERFHKLYSADADTAVEVLGSLPKTINLDGPTGEGPGAGRTGDAPEGVHEERHALDQRVQARIREHGESYSVALDAVLAEAVTA